MSDIPLLAVYFASKLANSWRVKQYEKDCPGIASLSRWVEYHDKKVPETEENAVWFWLVDESCVKDADVVVVFAEPSQHLRGALVEAGMAIAWNKIVVVIGDHPDFGTWQYHPSVNRVKDWNECKALLIEFRALLYRNGRPTGGDLRKNIWEIVKHTCP